ncbi:MAG: hypothetical protein ACRET6_02510 [Burkholderiales bacterium]
MLLRSIGSTTRRIGGALVHEIALGLHTNAAANVAECSPHVFDAVTEYLKRYVGLVPGLGASWTEMHTGCHFTKDKKTGMEAGKERPKRVVAHAEKKEALVLLALHQRLHLARRRGGSTRRSRRKRPGRGRQSRPTPSRLQAVVPGPAIGV